MPFELYLAFVAASALLILTPGPMVALIIANAVRYGPRFALATVVGSTVALAGQLVLVVAGLATALAAAGEAMFWIKWIGVAYLLYLGVRALRARVEKLDVETASAARSITAIFIEAVLVSATNPKTLLFYAAFFPLFISPAAPAGPQLALLSGTFLVVAFVIDCGWAFSATKARPFIARAGRWRNRITGGVLIAAAGALATVRKA